MNIGTAVKNILQRASLILWSTESAWHSNTPMYLEDKFENNARQGYSKNELIFRCISERADCASSPVMRLRNKRTGQVIEKHPLLDLIRQPNHRMSEYDLWSISIVYMDLAGKAYWQQMRAPAGNTVELWPIRPDRIRPIPDPHRLVKAYEYRAGGEPEVIDARDIIEISCFDPTSLYKGQAPASVASRASQVDNAQTDYLKLFFEHGGMPPGLIKTKKKLIDSDVTDIRRRWRQRYGGFENWTDPAVLDMDAEFQKTGFTFEEMGFDALDARSEIRICMALKVPPVLVGARVGLDRATYANFREARTAFWEDAMIPLFKHLRDTFQRELADEEWSDLELVWDFSTVPVLFQKQLEQRAQYRADFLAGGLLLDEYRMAIGLSPLPGNAGRVRVQSLAFQIIPEGEIGQSVPGAIPVGVGDTKYLTRSPACRKKGETVSQCVSRKVPEILDENPGMSNDQAVAIAHSMCDKVCSEKKDIHRRPDPEERQPVYDNSVALVASFLQEESTRVIEEAGKEA